MDVFSEIFTIRFLVITIIFGLIISITANLLTDKIRKFISHPWQKPSFETYLFFSGIIGLSLFFGSLSLSIIAHIAFDISKEVIKKSYWFVGPFLTGWFLFSIFFIINEAENWRNGTTIFRSDTGSFIERRNRTSLSSFITLLLKIVMFILFSFVLIASEDGLGMQLL